MVRRGLGSCIGSRACNGLILRPWFPLVIPGALSGAVVPVSLSGLVSVRVALKSAPSRHARPISEFVKGVGGILSAFSRGLYHNVMGPDLMRPYFARVPGR